MKIIRTDTEGADIEFSVTELDLLRNGLNEARLAVKGDADFQTRLGSPKAEADHLIKALQSLITDIDDRSGGRYSQPQDDQRAKITG